MQFLWLSWGPSLIYSNFTIMNAIETLKTFQTHVTHDVTHDVTISKTLNLLAAFPSPRAPYLSSSSFNFLAACLDSLICKSSLCKKSLAESSSGWGGLTLGSGGLGEGVGERPSVSGAAQGCSWGVVDSLSGDSRDSPLKREGFGEITGILRLFRRKMQSLPKSLLALLICSICGQAENWRDSYDNLSFDYLPQCCWIAHMRFLIWMITNKNWLNV